MDYLINESMRLYARSRDFSPAQGDAADAYQRRPTTRRPAAPHQGGRAPNEHRTFNQMPAVPRGAGAPQPPGGMRGPGGPPPPPPRPVGPPSPPRASHQPAPNRPLYLVFNNNRYIVDEDRFVIGRGSQQTNLTIRDGNISRQHCAVLRRNGQFYIKDMNSTNGVEYRGNRIESKRIEEGDVFYLCDYELRFTYRG